MKARILVKLSLPYDRTAYAPLIDLAEAEFYSKKEKKYVWVFDIKKLSEAIAVLGNEVEFDDEEVKQLIARCPNIREDVQRGSFKGEGFVDVVVFPKVFLVTTVMGKSIVKNRIPTETVEKLWTAIKKYKVNKPILTKTIAERYCETLGITRFHKPNENKPDEKVFDWGKFFGTRKYYLHFFFALKVLQKYGTIKHHRDGYIERLLDTWDIQSVLPKQEKTIRSDEL